MHGNNRCLPDGTKGMQRPGKIENVKKKIHARARNVLQRGISNFVWASVSGREEAKGSRKKFGEGEEGAKERVRLLRASNFSELGMIVSGSATQGVWLGDRRVRSQVIDEGRSRIPGRGAVRREGRRASDRTKKKVHRFRVRFGLERKASRLPCLSLGDDRVALGGQLYE